MTSTWEMDSLQGPGTAIFFTVEGATKLRIGTDKIELVRTIEQADKGTGCVSDQRSGESRTVQRPGC